MDDLMEAGERVDGEKEKGRKEGGGEREVEEMLKGLKLTEEERGGIRLERRRETVRKEEETLCLVGKLLSKRTFNTDAMANTLRMAWKLSNRMEFKELEGNITLFQFYTKQDLARVKDNGSWFFDGSALILKELEGDKRPTDIAFDKLAFWIRIYNLPLDYMSKEAGEKLGATIGEVLEVEADKNGKAWGRFLRMRINLEVKRPLKRGLMIYVGEEDEEGKWCRVAYERLSNFCYHCGMLDHIDRECKEPVAEGEKAQYGGWMRASPVKKKAWSGGFYNNTSQPHGRERGGEKDWGRDKEGGRGRGRVGARGGRSITGIERILNRFGTGKERKEEEGTNNSERMASTREEEENMEVLKTGEDPRMKAIENLGEKTQGSTMQKGGGEGRRSDEPTEDQCPGGREGGGWVSGGGKKGERKSTDENL